QLAEYIKQTPNLAHIPVLLLTGAFEPVDQARAAEVRCDGVLAKPFEPQLVVGRVKELLARPRGAPPAFKAASVASPAEPPKPATPNAPVPTVEDYFDRLDAALGSGQSGSREPKRASEPPAVTAVADPPLQPDLSRSGDESSPPAVAP